MLNIEFRGKLLLNIPYSTFFSSRRARTAHRSPGASRRNALVCRRTGAHVSRRTRPARTRSLRLALISAIEGLTVGTKRRNDSRRTVGGRRRTRWTTCLRLADDDVAIGIHGDFTQCTVARGREHDAADAGRTRKTGERLEIDFGQTAQRQTFAQLDDHIP